jgi:hypothetical protein
MDGAKGWCNRGSNVCGSVPPTEGCTKWQRTKWKRSGSRRGRGADPQERGGRCIWVGPRGNGVACWMGKGPDRSKREGLVARSVERGCAEVERQSSDVMVVRRTIHTWAGENKRLGCRRALDEIDGRKECEGMCGARNGASRPQEPIWGGSGAGRPPLVGWRWSRSQSTVHGAGRLHEERGQRFVKAPHGSRPQGGKTGQCCGDGGLEMKYRQGLATGAHSGCEG